ncbi:hypothetical protein Vi05172_g6037 [Venturia inaequalis]|uniref:Asl1-like glycosyl hydrolase catalytic domain-containing protein n=1 Tax=Venturia inaequalis TaxID=5025 RepID=A0A8H3VRX5_VENIN|nr:hypothetical protein EG327_010665 [Venturia inaequalis]RDI84154.1 hypothetical protein Vi05172_g6037 [Venturia inaequalis]
MPSAIALLLALPLAFVAGHEEGDVTLSGKPTVTSTSTNFVTVYTTPSYSNSLLSQSGAPGANNTPSVIISTITVNETSTTTIFVRPTPKGQYPSSLTNSTTPLPSLAVSGAPTFHVAASDTAGSDAPAKKPGKRGIPYNDAKYTKNFGSPNSPVTWQYNWNSKPYEPNNLSPGQLNPSLKYIPQLWSLAADAVAQWHPAVTAAIKDHNTDALLAYNEPDLCKEGAGASCMVDVAIAAKGYKDHMGPYYKTPNLKLGMPAVTNSPTGLPWAKKFLELCTDCQIDIAPMHFYTTADAPFDYFTSYVRNFTELVKPRKVWITEFALSGADEKANVEFLKRAMEWLDGNGDVERYSWFWAGPYTGSALVNEDASLTALGRLYNQ